MSEALKDLLARVEAAGFNGLNTLAACICAFGNEGWTDPGDVCLWQGQCPYCRSRARALLAKDTTHAE